MLTENRRQRDELERDALARVRAGVGRDYLAYAEKRERLVVSESPVTTRARLLADWWEHARDDLAGNVMLALRRRDVADLNQLARALMDTDGRLGKRPPHRRGPRVRRRRPRRLPPQLRPSSASRTAPAEPSSASTATSGRSTVATDRGPTVELSRRYLEAGNVRHAYALTGHAAQGLTVERAFVLGAGEARLQEWGYVALSRARDRDPPLRHRHPARAREPLPRPRRPRPARPLRPRTRGVRGRGARRRSAAAAVRAEARRATRDRAHTAQPGRADAAPASRAEAARAHEDAGRR